MSPTPPGEPIAPLLELYEAATAAASPLVVVPPCLPDPPAGRTVVVGAGKAAAEMALAVERGWSGDLSGVVVVPHGHDAPCRRIDVITAAHPVSDRASETAGQSILGRLDGLTADDLVLALISGGGSSLMAAPAPGVTLADKQAVVRALLRSGAPIADINCVRKHLSAIKGGRLAVQAGPARLVTLAISDAPDDDPSVIASGPTVPDPTTRAEALAVLEAWTPDDIPPAVRAWLLNPDSETPKPGPPDPRRILTIVADASRALQAAAGTARRMGLAPVILGAHLQGEARAVAARHADAVRRRLGEGRPRPLVLLSGGETTVTVRGDGRGGRNTEFLLALALALDGMAGVQALAADTDGVDGAPPHAGAWIDPETLPRARALGLDPRAFLDRNDSHGFFEALGQTVTTGPTPTNVNDFRAILIDDAAPPKGARP
ncbi:MAG: glycerate 2-kinase [Brevundimonas sp.]|jgi:glycerate 2-kinase|uniref:glycerate kinase type-2 family protein n=1 Tax=Brevundimonas sp. TaxID=1871086 RepID=UPI0039E642B3